MVISFSQHHEAFLLGGYIPTDGGMIIPFPGKTADFFFNHGTCGLYRYTAIAMQLAMQQMKNHEDGATVGHFSIKVSSHPKGMV